MWAKPCAAALHRPCRLDEIDASKACKPRNEAGEGRSLRLRLFADTSPGDRRAIDLGELGTAVGAVRRRHSLVAAIAK
jgi:hypothetical protein